MPLNSDRVVSDPAADRLPGAGARMHASRGRARGHAARDQSLSRWPVEASCFNNGAGVQ